ncbi:MAG: DUF58 domain-containing protein [Anaerolineae bacterium]
MGLFITVLFIIAAIMRVDFFFYILYVFFAVYLLSRFWVRRALMQVRVERRLNTHAFWGERVPVRLELSNNGLLPVPWLQLHESLPQPLAFPQVRSRALALWPHEKAVFTYELDCRKRGYYTIGPLRLSSGDLLGAGGRAFAEAGLSHLTVYPRLLPLSDLGIPSRSPFGAIKRSGAIHRDPARVAGVRDYRPGDTIRHINWKASAAHNKLQTKVFDPVISLDTAVFLDLEREHYEPAHVGISTEEAISVAASLVTQLARQRQPFSLASNGQDPLAENGGRGPVLPMRSGQAHLMTVLEALGRIENQAVEPLSSLLQRETLNLPWGCNVLIVSGNGDDLLGYTLRLQRSGFNVVIVLADYYSDLRRRGSELEQAGATVYRLRQSESLAKASPLRALARRVAV